MAHVMRGSKWFQGFYRLEWPMVLVGVGGFKVIIVGVATGDRLE